MQMTTTDSAFKMCIDRPPDLKKSPPAAKSVNPRRLIFLLLQSLVMLFLSFLFLLFVTLAITFFFLIIHLRISRRRRRRRRTNRFHSHSSSSSSEDDDEFDVFFPNNGLSPDDLHKLPCSDYRSILDSVSTRDRDRDRDRDCSICLEPFQEGEMFRILPLCNHVFHSTCIDRWLLNHASACPICRHSVV